MKSVDDILKLYLQLIPKEKKEYWSNLVSKQKESTVDGKVNIQKVYKVGLCSIIQKVSNDSFSFGKDAEGIYLYNESYWEKISSKLFKSFINKIGLKLDIPSWLAQEDSFIEGVYKQIYSYIDFFEDLNETEDCTYLNLKNGTLKISLDGIEFLDFNAKHHLDYQLDFDYGNKAVNEKLQLFLDQVLPDKDTQKTLQQALGYLLTSSIKLETAIFLYGTGSNGKSVIFEILTHLFSQKLVTHYSLESLVSSSYHRANINSKLINYASDISIKKMNASVFKQLVSGEPLEVRQIYKEPFIMKKYAKLIFNINKIDDAQVESTYGFFRRFTFIPFEQTVKPEQQDKMLHKNILEDKAGVLNWILDGTQEVLSTKSIFLSENSTNFLEKFKRESNIAQRFVDEMELKKSTKEIIEFQTLYETFIDYCKKEGERPFKKQQFNNELRKLEFIDKRNRQGMVWYAKFRS